MKALLTTLEAENPNVRRNLLAALGNVRPTHLLDRDLTARLGLVEANEGDESVARLVTLGRDEARVTPRRRRAATRSHAAFRDGVALRDALARRSVARNRRSKAAA